MKVRGLSGVLLTILPAILCAESPLEYLDRALRAERMTPGVFIQQHRNFAGQKTQKVMVMRDGEGQSLVTILEPLNLQGVQSFDTGREMHTYYPDSKQLIIRPWGSQQARVDPKMRMRLIERNYKVSSGKGPKVAGLLTTKITAQPVAKDVPRRTMYFARGSTNLLKIEVSLGKQNSTIFETLSQSPYSGTLQPPASNGWDRATTWGPKPMGTDQQTRVLLRIAPVIPKTLPKGFEVVDSFYNGRDAESAFLITRVTDGLTLVTILQGQTKVMPTIPGTEQIKARGVSVIADGLAPAPLLTEILEAFSPTRAQSPRGELATTANSYSQYPKK
ncbi:MAG: hypothetical protein JNJ45_00075 [Chthonomonas sp.]|nr:hypothetical protein [Chthonomonas sp.]